MCAGCLRNSTFGSQLLYAHILPHSASVTRLDSHTSKKIRIYIKTSGFKPFRHTYLQSAILQSLLNHILTKNRGWGVGYPFGGLTFDFELSTLDFVLPVTLG